MLQRINLDKPQNWKSDIEKSVDFYNSWFIKFAPEAYKKERLEATKRVLEVFELTADLKNITTEVLAQKPDILSTLRMASCPPLARDRLTGLSGARRAVVQSLEDAKLPTRMSKVELKSELDRIISVLERLLDRDLLPWLAKNISPTEVERDRSATIIADRLCGSQADPIIRNAQEIRQLEVIEGWLNRKGYKKIPPFAMEKPLEDMPAGTFAFRMNILVGQEHGVRIPVDVVIQPRTLRKDKIPLLIEAKSAGDFANVNKRRKEEAQKFQQLRARFGLEVQYILFLCGYFDSGYLGYEAAEGIDWVWEHRIDDLEKVGL